MICRFYATPHFVKYLKLDVVNLSPIPYIGYIFELELVNIILDGDSGDIFDVMEIVKRV